MSEATAKWNNTPEQNIHRLVTLQFCGTVFLCETQEMTLFNDKIPWVGSSRVQHPVMFISRIFWVHRLKFEQPISFCFPKIEFHVGGLSKFEFVSCDEILSAKNGELMDSVWQLQQHGFKVGCTVKFGQFATNFQLQSGVMSNHSLE